ncbi:MAG: hypothetical protein ABSF31_08640 [Steroidobacteraceae bacterium]|jgi:CRISPR/Cas system-associated endonuclease Cas3-HD
MSKIVKTMVATAVFFAAGCTITAAVAADAPAAAYSSKLKSALTPLAQLLQLMDTDKNGKVSKDEFMKFMEAEFDYADKNKDGQLDPIELKSLVYKMSHPYAAPRNLGK